MNWVGYVKCPQCGCACCTEDDYGTFEYYANCYNCGYSRTITRKMGRRSRVIVGKDGKPVFVERCAPGYGVMTLAHNSGISQMYVLSRPYRKKDKRVFEKFLKTAGADPERSKLIVWDKQAKCLKSVYGELPLAYDE